MISLQELVRSGGVFSSDVVDGLQREFVPFNEQLSAEYLAKEINKGRLSVKEAYTQFWSYEEDSQVWGLPRDQEWRALLPSWVPIIISMAPLMEERYAEQIMDICLSSFWRFYRTERQVDGVLVEYHREPKRFFFDPADPEKSPVVPPDNLPMLGSFLNVYHSYRLESENSASRFNKEWWWYNPFSFDLDAIAFFSSRADISDTKAGLLAEMIAFHTPYEEKYLFWGMCTALANANSSRSIEILRQIDDIDFHYSEERDPWWDVELREMRPTPSFCSHNAGFEAGVLSEAGEFEHKLRGNKLVLRLNMRPEEYDERFVSQAEALEGFRREAQPFTHNHMNPMSSIETFHLLLKPRGYFPSVKKLALGESVPPRSSP